MKLKTDNFRFGSDLPSVVKALTQLLPDFAKQVNAVSEGRVAGSYNAAIAAPTAPGFGLMVTLCATRHRPYWARPDLDTS